jgi:hypothetical protein
MTGQGLWAFCFCNRAGSFGLFCFCKWDLARGEEGEGGDLAYCSWLLFCEWGGEVAMIMTVLSLSALQHPESAPPLRPFHFGMESGNRAMIHSLHHPSSFLLQPRETDGLLTRVKGNSIYRGKERRGMRWREEEGEREERGAFVFSLSPPTR